MARKKLYTVRREVCLTPAQDKKLEELAEKEGLTVNQVIRNIVEASI